jgi:hypothetical protein
MNKAQEELKYNFCHRWRQEAREVGLRITYIKFDVENEEEYEKREKVKEFLEEKTEKTENEKDIIVTNDLWDKYDDWNRDPKNNGGPSTMVESATGMGMYLGQLNYNKFIGKINGKTVRGYTNIRYKSETSKVNEFLSKFTIKTESGDDRIALLNLLMVYREWVRGGSPPYDDEPSGQRSRGKKIGETEFKNSANKYGYKMKAAVEKPYYINSTTGKKKKRPNQVITHCFTKLKWLPGAIESLNYEGLKEKLNIECDKSASGA